MIGDLDLNFSIYFGVSSDPMTLTLEITTVHRYLHCVQWFSSTAMYLMIRP